MLTPRLRISHCPICKAQFAQDRHSRYTVCSPCRTPAALAAFGYGWEDLVVKTGISREQAREIVFRRDRLRLDGAEGAA